MGTRAGIGLLFAGQGAQAVGMGRDLFEALPEVRDLYARASEISGIDLAKVSFEGPLEELTRTEVSQPAIVTASLPVLSNFTGRPYGDVGDPVDLLHGQMSHPVRWTDCLRRMSALGATTFYELGPGCVLSGLVRKTLDGATCHTLLDLASFEAAGLAEVPAR